MASEKTKQKLSRRNLLTTSAGVLATTAVSKASTQKKKQHRFSNPAGLSTPRGYSHVVEATPGRTVYIAGQVALDKDGNLVGKDDFRAQAQQTFENVKIALASVGADFSHVVKLNNYFTDMTKIAIFREVRDQYVNKAAPPASTAVEVRKLARDEWMVEVEAIVVIPN